MSSSDTDCLHISLTQMLDLALGSAEFGAVNMNMLYNFLHVFLNMNTSKSAKVEYKGEDAYKIKKMISSLKPESNLYLYKYSVINNFEDREQNCDMSVDGKDFSSEVQEDLNEVGDQTQREIKYPVLTHTENIERLCGGGDLMEQVTIVNEQSSEKEGSVSSLNSITSHVENEKNKQSSSDNNIEKIEDGKEEDSDSHLKITVEKPIEVVTKSSTNVSSADSKSEQSEFDILGEVNCCKLRADTRAIETDISTLRKELCDLKEKMYKMMKSEDMKDTDSKNKCKHMRKCAIVSEDSPDKKYLVITQKQSDMKPTRCTDMICEIEKSLIKSIACLDKRFETFEEFVNCSLKNINGIISKNNNEELLNYVKGIRSEFCNIRKDILQLQNDKDGQDKLNEIFEEKINALKCVKADKIEVEDLLADKADICALNKKVSHEQFDAACEELTRSLEEVISKLSQQESMWQQSLLELRCEFEGKLDALEIQVLKDFINVELQALKNQIRILSEIKREQEAAGARKILRNLRCISCDKDACMHTDQKQSTMSPPFPCRPSVGPYLAYKMCQVRAQKIADTGKNLINLEKIMKEDRKENQEICLESCDEGPREHTCNRYCGGSHTMISPQQRVKKPKYCTTQLDKNDQNPLEGFVEGIDGQMYRGRSKNNQLKPISK